MEKQIRFELFEIKQKFLREIPHPKLIAKEIRLLTQKGKLETPDLPVWKEWKIELNEQTGLENYLNTYITSVLTVKHSISQQESYIGLRTVLTELLHLQWEFLKKLQSYVPEIPEEADKEIKQSAPIDAYQLLKGIQFAKLKENEIKHYLCRKINDTESPFDETTVAFLRANKIVNHG